MRRLLLVTGFAVLAGVAGWAGAADAGPAVPASLTPPDALLGAATRVVTASLRQDREGQTGGPEKLADLVESTILPLFDLRRMTRLAVARDWRLAAPEQRDALIAGVRTLVVRAYSTALANYGDQAIEYKPLRMAPGESRVTVKSTVRQPGAARTTIDYDMERTAAGWKIYDVKIAGVSLIAIYRSAFGRTIRDGGVDGLIQSLSARNPRVDSGSGTSEITSRPLLFIIYAVIPGVFRSGR